MSPKQISGSPSRSESVSRSLTVKEYEKKFAERPKPKFWKVGNHLSILTGANVTRKRRLTRKVAYTAFVEGSKTVFWSMGLKKSTREAGAARRRRNAALNAGQKFDSGINKLVEDMATGKNLSDTSWGRMKFSKRVDALYKQAEILKAKGAFKDDDIAERFRINLMESLRVVQATFDKKDYGKVLSQITKDILPRFEDSVGSPADDESDTNKQTDEVLARLDKGGLVDFEEFQKEQTFKRSTVVAALRDVETFGCDKKKFDAFGGSRLLHDTCGGDPDALEAFGNDPAAYQSFNGNQKNYNEWGGCGRFYERFGNNPAELAGTKGAAALCDWLNETYGPGSGDAFFEEHPRHQNGAKDEKSLNTLGVLIRSELEDYEGVGINYRDLKVDNVVNGPNTPLKDEFENHLKTAKRGEAVGNWPTLKCLRDLEILRREGPSLEKKTLLEKIKEMAERTMSPESGLYVSRDGKKDFRKTVEMLAYNKFSRKSGPFEKTLKALDDLDKNQLLEVLNKGLAQADKDLRKTINTILKDLGKIRVAENKHRLHKRYVGQLIDDVYGGGDKGPIGNKMVEQRLEKKRTEVLDDQRDRTMIDGQDLRIIEKELYAQGYVRADSKQARKKNKPGPELQISQSSMPQENDNYKKIEIDDSLGAIFESSIAKKAAKSVTSKLTGGSDLPRVRNELRKLPKDTEEHVIGQARLLLSDLEKVDNGAPLANKANDIADHAKAVRASKIFERKRYAGLGAMLNTVILNAQKAAIGGDIKDDIKTDP